MAEKKQAVSIEQLSHFKVKQDLENLEKFKLKTDSTDLKGAVRYDAAQALTEQEKAQARANIGAGTPGEGGNGEYDVIVVRGTYSVDGTKEYINITSEAAATINANLNSGKSMLLYLDNYTWYYHARNGEFSTLVRKGLENPFYSTFTYVDGQTEFLINYVKLAEFGSGTSGGSVEGAVRYDVEQVLTDEQKATARENIGTTDGTWESMPDKPFYGNEEIVCLFDKTETPNPTAFYLTEMQTNFYKVFTPTFSKEELKNVVITRNDDDWKFTFGENNIIVANSQGMLLNINSWYFVVAYEIGELTFDVTDKFGVTITLNIEETGIYINNFDNFNSLELFVKGNIKTIDKKYIPSEVGTWGNMSDKPFYEKGMKIEWDKTPTSVFETVDTDERLAYFYKVGETVETILNGTIRVVDEEGEIIDILLESDVVQDVEGGENGVYIINVKIPNSTFTTFFDADITFKETGLYFFYEKTNEGEEVYIKSFACSDYEVKQIDSKYIPDDIKIELPEGIVTTDENGLIPASVLPSYVDDVVEGSYVTVDGINDYFNDLEGNKITPEKGKIYVSLNADGSENKIYRWGGSTYVQLNPPEITFATNADIDALFE